MQRCVTKKKINHARPLSTANTLLVGIPSRNPQKQQSIQSSAAEILVGVCMCDRISPYCVPYTGYYTGWLLKHLSSLGISLGVELFSWQHHVCGTGPSE